MPAALLGRFRPPSKLAGRVALPNALFSIGHGTFVTGSAVFYTMVVGLRPAQVGIGLTVAGAAALLASWPLGRLIDRFGSKKMVRLALVIGAALFLGWPFITTFPAYIAMETALAVNAALGVPAINAYTIGVLPPEERVSSRAFVYSGINLGLTIGALGSGIALALNSLTLIRFVPVFTAVAFLVAALAITLLPDLTDEERQQGQRRVRVPGPGPLRNPGWMSANFFSSVVMTNNVLLNVVIPLWLVQRTDAPHVVLALLFGTNTLMCVFLPMAAARGVRDSATALRAVRIATGFFVTACVITLFTDRTVGLVTIGLIWVGHIAVTGAELYQQAANWSFDADLMDPRRRGEYQGAGQLSRGLGQVWAPALFTYLALTLGTAGWLIIAGIAVVAGLSLHPSVRLAERFLEQHVPDEAAPGEPVAADHETPPLPLSWLADSLIEPEPEG